MAACAAFSLSTHAEGYRSVRVELKEGSPIEIQLSGSLRTTFAEGVTTFADNAGTAVNLPSANIVRFTFLERDAQSSIHEVAMPQIQRGALHFSALAVGTTITVTDASGHNVLTSTAEGDFTLPLNQFIPGIYLVSVNGITYKVQLR